jgi:hypothetical protein
MPKLDGTHIHERLRQRLEQLKNGEEVARRELETLLTPGARQDSCRLIHAANPTLWPCSALAVATIFCFSGFNVTTSTHDQLRVALAQRPGFLALACW